MVELFANCKNIEQIQIVAASFNNKVISSVIIFYIFNRQKK